MNIIIITLLIIVILIFFAAINAYNVLLTTIESIEFNKQQIDIQLDRRFQIFLSLIESVKKFMDYDRSTLKDIITLRTRAETAQSVDDQKTRIAAENEISKIVTELTITFEQYPELKSGKNVMQLREEIANTESKLAYAKQAYNDSIERYNAKKKSFIDAMLIKLFPNKFSKNFPDWTLAP